MSLFSINPPLIEQVKMAEWSKALRLGRSLSGGVGSNPTLDNLFCIRVRDFDPRFCYC